MTDDRGLAALAERLDKISLWQSPLDQARAILGPSGRFSPDGGLDAEWLADGLCMAQEAGQHLDQVAETTAWHWRNVAARTVAALATPKEEPRG